MINQLITPYPPSRYNIKSTHESIQILHTLKPNNGILASFNIENLFTWVPISSDVVNPALADASSYTWEFSLTFNSSALLANPR